MSCTTHIPYRHAAASSAAPVKPNTIADYAKSWWPFSRTAASSSTSPTNNKNSSSSSGGAVAVVPRHRTFLFLTPRCPQYFSIEFVDTSLFGFHHAELVVYGSAAGPSFAGRLAIVVGVRGGALWVLDEGEVAARPLILSSTSSLINAAAPPHNRSATSRSSSRKRARSRSPSSPSSHPPPSSVSHEAALVQEYGLYHYALLNTSASSRRRLEAMRLQRTLQQEVVPLPHWSGEAISFLQHAPDLVATFHRRTANGLGDGSEHHEDDEEDEEVVRVVLTPNITSAGTLNKDDAGNDEVASKKCTVGWCGEATAPMNGVGQDGVESALYSFSCAVVVPQ